MKYLLVLLLAVSSIAFGKPDDDDNDRHDPVIPEWVKVVPAVKLGVYEGATVRPDGKLEYAAVELYSQEGNTIKSSEGDIGANVQGNGKFMQIVWNGKGTLTCTGVYNWFGKVPELRGQCQDNNDRFLFVMRLKQQ